MRAALSNSCRAACPRRPRTCSMLAIRNIPGHPPAATSSHARTPSISPSNAASTFSPKSSCILGEPDQRLDRLDLAEEGPDAAEAVVAPVPQQAGGLRRDLPITRLRQRPPPVHVAAQLVDDGRRVVLLGLRGHPGAVPELQRVLGAGGLPFPRLRDGSDELGPPAPVDQPVGRLPLSVELPMAGGGLVRRVDDRLGEEAVCHEWLRPPFAAGLGPGVRIPGSGCPDSGFQGPGAPIPDSGVRVSGFRGPGVRGPGSGCPGSGCPDSRVRGPGARIPGSGSRSPDPDSLLVVPIPHPLRVRLS